jgi:2-dehydro-3-deoxyphosphogluconate aldolase/(4S)-4-hydroxy-2-oxoglutarate aldolase
VDAMKKEQIITRIRETGLVAVVRAESEDKAVGITEACLEGGVPLLRLPLP